MSSGSAISNLKGSEPGPDNFCPSSQSSWREVLAPQGTSPHPTSGAGCTRSGGQATIGEVHGSGLIMPLLGRVRVKVRDEMRASTSFYYFQSSLKGSWGLARSLGILSTCPAQSRCPTDILWGWTEAPYRLGLHPALAGSGPFLPRVNVTPSMKSLDPYCGMVPASRNRLHAFVKSCLPL